VELFVPPLALTERRMTFSYLLAGPSAGCTYTPLMMVLMSDMRYVDVRPSNQPTLIKMGWRGQAGERQGRSVRERAMTVRTRSA
jgi:hypothetical protein